MNNLDELTKFVSAAPYEPDAHRWERYNDASREAKDAERSRLVAIGDRDATKLAQLIQGWAEECSRKHQDAWEWTNWANAILRERGWMSGIGTDQDRRIWILERLRKAEQYAALLLTVCKIAQIGPDELAARITSLTAKEDAVLPS